MEKKEKSTTIKTIENLADIIPFSMVSIVFFSTLIAGLFSGLDLLSVMLRAIIGVVIFTAIGFFIRIALKHKLKIK